MGNVRRVCKGYTPTWIPWQTEIDKTGIEIGKTPPWEEAGAGEKPEEEILEERTFHIFFPFRLLYTYNHMHTLAQWGRKRDTLWSVCTVLVKTIEAVKIQQIQVQQPKPTDHMHPTTQQKQGAKSWGGRAAIHFCLMFTQERRADRSNHEAQPGLKLTAHNYVPR